MAVGAPRGAALAYINAHAGAWDSKRRATLIFGGADERRVLGNLWQLRSGRWRLLSASGPGPRTFPAVTYDSRRDRLVIFGGNRVLFGGDGQADTLLDDHWEWNGRSWRRFGGRRPPSRTEASLTYDPVQGRSILFGGWRWQDGTRVRLGDLWAFDGVRWTEIPAAGPDPRSGMAAAWDPVGERIVMIGGNGPKKDAWALHGSGWRRMPDLPSGRFNPSLAFNRSGSGIVFGGWTGRERIAETLRLEGENWRPFAGPEPPPRNHASLVAMADGSRLLLVGGHDGDRVFADQWEWSGQWRLLRAGVPTQRIDNGH